MDTLAELPRWTVIVAGVFAAIIAIVGCVAYLLVWLLDHPGADASDGEEDGPPGGRAVASGQADKRA